jgi:hypothetical protein
MQNFKAAIDCGVFIITQSEVMLSSEALYIISFFQGDSTNSIQHLNYGPDYTFQESHM